MPPRVVLEHERRRRTGAAPDGIVVVGMGGSALAGDLLAHFADHLNLPVPVFVWKNWGLPVTRRLVRPLFVFISFSGNTEETNSGLRVLLATKQQYRSIAVVTTGGTLLRIAREHRLLLARFDAGDLTPRDAVWYTYRGLTELLRTIFPTVRRLAAQKPYSAKRFTVRGAAIARRLKNSIPLIYTDRAFAAIGYLWKIHLNETGKHPAFTAALPEAAHNEISGFETGPNRFTALFLEIPGTSAFVKRSTVAFRSIIARSGARTVRIPLRSRTFDAATWEAVALAEATALALARLKHRNPQETKLINELKRRVYRR